MKIRVSDYICKFLVDKGIHSTFFLSGGGMMHLIDAVGKTKQISYFCNHHEQASTMAADAYARVSEGAGAVFLTSGPGGTNAVTGIVEAWLDSSPVICFTGQSKLVQTIQNSKINGLRQFGTFEVDIVSIVKPITKYTAFLDDPRKIKEVLEEAYFKATTGRPGPVLIDIPVDIQGALIDVDELNSFEPPVSVNSDYISHNEISSIIQKMTSAKRPLIIAGYGVRASGQVEKFKEFIDKYNIPVVTNGFAVDIMEFDHPLFVGHPGGKGDRAGNFAVQNADFILTLGTSLHVMTTGYEIDKFAPNAYKVMVDLDKANFERQEVSIDIMAYSSIQHFIKSSEEISDIDSFDGTEWLNYCQKLKTELDVMNEPHLREDLEKGKGISYYDVFDELSKHTKGDEIFVTDAGLPYYIIGQALKIKKGQRVINSGGLGAMGYAIPAAIGAAAAKPERTIVCITGDGSLQTNIQELATLKRYDFNIKLIVVNNGGYVSIRNTQNNYFKGNLVGSDTDSGVWIPDLEKIASAYELDYKKTSLQKELPQKVEEILGSRGVKIMEVFIPKDGMAIPTVSSRKLDDGTMVSMPLHEMFPFLDEKDVQKYMINDD